MRLVWISNTLLLPACAVAYRIRLVWGCNGLQSMRVVTYQGASTKLTADGTVINVKRCLAGSHAVRFEMLLF